MVAVIPLTSNNPWVALFTFTLTCTSTLPQNGTTPLYMASQKNHVEVIKVLLASGAKINLGRKVRILLTVGELGDSDYIGVVACSMCPTSFSP